MKISLGWLKEFVDITEDARSLAQKVTGVGLAFVSRAAVHSGLREKLGLKKKTVAVNRCRGLTRQLVRDNSLTFIRRRFPGSCQVESRKSLGFSG